MEAIIQTDIFRSIIKTDFFTELKCVLKDANVEIISLVPAIILIYKSMIFLTLF